MGVKLRSEKEIRSQIDRIVTAHVRKEIKLLKKYKKSEIKGLIIGVLMKNERIMNAAKVTALKWVLKEGTINKIKPTKKPKNV